MIVTYNFVNLFLNPFEIVGRKQPPFHAAVKILRGRRASIVGYQIQMGEDINFEGFGKDGRVREPCRNADNGEEG